MVGGKELGQRELLREATTLFAVLETCASNKDIFTGIRVHNDILRRGLLDRCCDGLVRMYAKCGALAKAKELLDTHRSQNVVTWTALISAYAWSGYGQDALNCFEQMQHLGLFPDAVTFICILKACGSIRAVDKGAQIHDEILKTGLLKSHIVLGNALVHMYAKCGALAKAQQVLWGLALRDVVSWNALIAGYSNVGQGEEALECYKQMRHEGLSPDAVTFICILKACGSIKAVDRGEQIHDEIAERGLLECNVVLGNALLDMYAKCGALSKARVALENLAIRDVISWNTLIGGYVLEGQGDKALNCFEHMVEEGIYPDATTFACILKAYGSIGAVDKGAIIHKKIVKQDLLRSDVVLGNSLVDMYVKCGALAKAQCVLEELPVRNIVSWSALIAGYVEYGKGEHAMECFELMQREGLTPDVVTYACILRACGSTGEIEKGERIHHDIGKWGLLEDNLLIGNILVDMYAKCGALSKAQQAHNQLLARDVVSWSVLISGYVHNSQPEQALNCFEQMQQEGLSPDGVTFASVLKACGSVRAADKGGEIHHELAKCGLLQNNIVLGNALVDMYAKCGALSKARQVLEELPIRNVVSWNALMTGYVQQGEVEHALDCFGCMHGESIPTDAAAFSCALSACSLLSLVKNAQMYLLDMTTKFGIEPELKHYTTMVDLLGRSGHLHHVVGLIEKLPSFDSAVWASLLGACEKWGSTDFGRWAFECAVQVDKCDVAGYVLMANIYAAAGM